MKLFRKQLTLLQRMGTNDPGVMSRSIIIAGWHPHWSITWSWSLTWSPRNPLTRLGFYFLGRRFMGLNSRLVGDWNLQRQSTIRRTRTRSEVSPSAALGKTEGQEQ